MPLGLKAAKCSKDSIKLAWNKVKGADGYMVFGSKCGGANKLELLGKATKTSFTSSDLSQKTAYKFVVVAYKGYNGNDKTLAISKTIHAFTEGGKVANYKKVKVNKTKATLKKGKTFKIKAKLVKPSKKKVKKHLGIRYESDNTAVATVASNGKVKAVGKGSCYVYAYAQNGICSKVKITVK